MSWLRWWDGTCSDPKWRVIAARSGQPVGNIVAIWAWLLERARQSDGCLGELDAEEIAVTYGYEPEGVEAILRTLADKGLIEEGEIRNWRKRQPKREDDSRDRVKAWREKKAEKAVTATHDEPRNAPVTLCNAPEAEAETERTEANASVSRPKAKKSAIKPEWQPSESGLEYAAKRGLSGDALWREVTRFVNHHTSKGNLMASWDAAWRTWIDSPYRQTGHAPPGKALRNNRSMLDGLDEIERRFADERPAYPRLAV